MKVDKTIVQIFGKWPVKGEVKTRLIPDLGEKKATDIYRYMLRSTIERAFKLPNSFAIELWLNQIIFDNLPINKAMEATHIEEYFLPKNWQKRLTIYQQIDGNLGEKIYHAMSTGLKKSSKVILVGSDCPEIGVTHYVRCGSLLDMHKVVIIPAIDGGYVLIGGTKIDKNWFNNIDWSTDQVLNQTKSALQKTGLSPNTDQPNIGDNSDSYFFEKPLRDLDLLDDYLYYKNTDWP